MSNFDDFLGTMKIRDIRENPSIPILPPYSPIGSNKQLDKTSRMSRIFGADPYDQAERHAIQQEGNEISTLPDKPALSLAEQAALVLDGHSGGIGLLVDDLRTVARNFVLADYIEAGNGQGYRPIGAEIGRKGKVAPVAPLASLTPMIPDPEDKIPGFEGMPDLTPSEHGEILRQLTNPAQESPAAALSTTGATPATTMQHRPDMAPSRLDCAPTPQQEAHGFQIVSRNKPIAPNWREITVSCGSCAEFAPGKTRLGIGRCSRTANGLPPVASRGYGVCFPIAPRSCPDHKEIL